MDGNLNIRRLFGCIFCAIMFFSCRNDELDPQKIIQDNFLVLVDTTVYKYGSFRPLPPLRTRNVKYVRYPAFSIALKDSVGIDLYEEDLDKFFSLNTFMKDEFRKLHQTSEYSKFVIDERFPKKIDKYFITFKDSTDYPNLKYAGELVIKNAKFSDKIGFLIVEESEDNSTISFIVFFQKIQGDWKVVKREVFFQT